MNRANPDALRYTGKREALAHEREDVRGGKLYFSETVIEALNVQVIDAGLSSLQAKREARSRLPPT
jgi:hypothetical protein